MLAQALATNEGCAVHATATDCCVIFAEEMPSLYLLALLLTGNKDKASQCLVLGLADCGDRIGRFIERARARARRAIVKRAINMIRPEPQNPGTQPFFSTKDPENNRFSAIVTLDAFERFVFVMSVLEGQSDRDCQRLLRCTQQELATARVLALALVTTASCV